MSILLPRGWVNGACRAHPDHEMEIDDMIENNSRAPWRRALSRRRLALMGSVAVLGIAVLAGGPGGYVQGTPQAFATTAHAAAAAEEKPAGFADIVEKVTPAVISVRVKIDQDANQHLTRNEASPF